MLDSPIDTLWPILITLGNPAIAIQKSHQEFLPLTYLLGVIPPHTLPPNGTGPSAGTPVYPDQVDRVDLGSLRYQDQKPYMNL